MLANRAVLDRRWTAAGARFFARTVGCYDPKVEKEMDAVTSEDRRLFAANVKRRDERVDLALACLLIAKAEYPRVVIEEYLMRLDQMATELQVEIDRDGNAASQAGALAAFLAEASEFRGDSEAYSPSASSPSSSRSP